MYPQNPGTPPKPPERAGFWAAVAACQHEKTLVGRQGVGGISASSKQKSEKVRDDAGPYPAKSISTNHAGPCPARTPQLYGQGCVPNSGVI